MFKCLPLCLYHWSTAAAVAGGFAAKVGRRQQILTDSWCHCQHIGCSLHVQHVGCINSGPTVSRSNVPVYYDIVHKLQHTIYIQISFVKCKRKKQHHSITHTHTHTHTQCMLQTNYSTAKKLIDHDICFIFWKQISKTKINTRHSESYCSCWLIWLQFFSELLKSGDQTCHKTKIFVNVSVWRIWFQSWPWGQHFGPSINLKVKR